MVGKTMCPGEGGGPMIITTVRIILLSLALLLTSVLPLEMSSSAHAEGVGSVEKKRITQADLKAAEHSVFSQNGEDGIVKKIFEVIPPTNRLIVDFGAGDGVQLSNSHNLILNKGWGGLLMEGSSELVRRMQETYKNNEKVTAIHQWVYPGNIEILMETHGIPHDLDLISIDIDSNDYYVWRAITSFRPKVVLIEFNGSYAPPAKMVVEYHPMNYWDGSDYYGASIQSLYLLGKKKGYELVYCDSKGVNLFFVDKKYFHLFDIPDNSPTALYNPPQFGLVTGGRAPNGRGWPQWESFTQKKWFGSYKPYDKPLTWESVSVDKKLRSDLPLGLE